jgi:hypothetical protein
MMLADPGHVVAQIVEQSDRVDVSLKRRGRGLRRRHIEQWHENAETGALHSGRHWLCLNG